MCTIDWTAISGIASSLAALVSTGVAILIYKTYIVYDRQAQTMREQLDQAKDASKTQALFDLIIKMEGERKSRSVVMNLANTGDPGNWSEEEKDAANTVAATYNLAGLLVRFGKVDRDIILPEWKSVIPKFHEQLKAYIASERVKRKHNELWSHFDWLTKEIGSHK